jgi:predicted lipoprotein with Yx(FWY)xxD motif
VRRLLGIASIATLVIALAGWGYDAPTRAKGKPAAKVQVHGSQYGDVLFDGKGFVLYLFTKDKPSKSRCNGNCAEAWPPYIKKGKLNAGDGVEASALGTTKRKDGSKQVTYYGHPLYYYEHDDKPGQILCHDVTEFGGDWLVVQPDGQPAP